MALNRPILEACVESIAEAIRAEHLGADRLELCARLDLDGITPDVELILSVLAAVHIPVKVMIRPRAGDFLYSPDEVRGIKHTINKFKSFGIDGIVFGALKNGQLDIDLLNHVAHCAYPIPITVHKAIDSTDDIQASVRQLVEAGSIRSILTSGGASTALKGARVIQKMIEIAGNHISIIAAGKITAENLDSVRSKTGANEFHGRRIVGALSSSRM